MRISVLQKKYEASHANDHKRHICNYVKEIGNTEKTTLIGKIMEHGILPDRVETENSLKWNNGQENEYDVSGFELRSCHGM